MKVEIRLVCSFVTLADSLKFSKKWPKNIKIGKIPKKIKVKKTRTVVKQKIHRQPMPSFVKNVKKTLTSGLMGYSPFGFQNQNLSISDLPTRSDQVNYLNSI